MRDKSDPIERAKRDLFELGFADEAALKAIDKEVREIVTAAADFAENAPEPAPAELFTDVLVGSY